MSYITRTCSLYSPSCGLKHCPFLPTLTDFSLGPHPLASDGCDFLVLLVSYAYSRSNSFIIVEPRMTRSVVYFPVRRGGDWLIPLEIPAPEIKSLARS